MARPRKNPAPTYTRRDAEAAARFIRTRRIEAGDLAAQKLPTGRLDDDELDAFLVHCEQHTDIDREVLGAELKARATLLAYLKDQDQRAQRRRTRQELSILLTGAVSEKRAAWYGEPLGLSPQNVYNRRNALTRQLSTTDDGARQNASVASEWLVRNRDEVAEIGEALVDQRPEVVQLLQDLAARDRLAELIDDVGEALAPLPDLDFAELVVAALRTWQSGKPGTTSDTVLRDLDSRGRRLIKSYAAAAAEAYE